MALPTWGLLRTAILGVLVAMLGYRLRYDKIQRTSVSGPYFEDTLSGSGERRSFRYAANSAGEPVMVMNALLRPGLPGALPGKSGSPPQHWHKAQIECFTVKRGHFGYMADGKEGLVVGGTPEAATPVCIQPGIPHTFWNARNTTELDLDVSLDPPLNSEQFFRTITAYADATHVPSTGLGRDHGGLNNVGMPQLLSTFAEGGVAIADMPKPVWRAMEAFVVPHLINGIMGIKPFPPEYLSE